MAEGEQDTGDADLSVQPKLPKEMEAAKDAVQKLSNNMKSLDASPDRVTFLMGVNYRTGKADLIPLPTKSNMEKLQEHHKDLPENIRKVIDRNMSEEDKQAMEEIWKVLGEQKAIEDKEGENDASG